MKAWLQGRCCAFGEQCGFAHGEEELQPLPFVNFEKERSFAINFRPNRQNPKFKTRICENYTTTGICPFGNRCFFIHPQPNASIDDVLEYKEVLLRLLISLKTFLQALDQRARQLEGRAIIQQEEVVIPLNQIVASPKSSKKPKQLRKLESCGDVSY